MVFATGFNFSATNFMLKDIKLSSYPATIISELLFTHRHEML